MPKVLLVTFVGMPYDVDSKVLIKALSARRVKAEVAAWDDPTVDWGSADLCVIKSASNYMFKPKQFLDWAEDTETKCPIWNRSGVLSWNSDKHYLLDLRENEVPIPPTIIMNRDEVRPIRKVLAETRWKEIVVKPTVAAGSFGLKRFTSDLDDMDSHIEKLTKSGFVQVLDGVAWPSMISDVIIQQYVPDVLRGESSLMFFGGEFSHAVLKKAKRGDFRSHPIWGATVEPYVPTASELRVARKALSVAGDVEYARIDLVNTAESPLLFEMELIEPFFFFDMFPGTAETFADHITSFL